MPTTIEIQFVDSTDSSLTKFQDTIVGTGHWVNPPPATLQPGKLAYGTCDCETGATITVVYKPDAVRLLSVVISLHANGVQLNTAQSPGYQVLANSQWQGPKYIVAVEYRTA